MVVSKVENSFCISLILILNELILFLSETSFIKFFATFKSWYVLFASFGFLIYPLFIHSKSSLFNGSSSNIKLWFLCSLSLQTSHILLAHLEQQYLNLLLWSKQNIPISFKDIRACCLLWLFLSKQ